MHYVIFLIRHGFSPYTGITDSNLPGSYAVEWAGISVMGDSDVGWRLWNASLGLLLVSSFAYSAADEDWLGGLLGGTLFLSLQFADGPQFAVERDYVATVLLAVATAALIASIRRGRCWPIVLFGGSCAAAASIKPTYGAAILLICFAARKANGTKSLLPHSIIIAVASFATVLITEFLVLDRLGSLHGLVWVVSRVIPAYSALDRLTFMTLLQCALPRSVGVLLLLSLYPLLTHHDASPKARLATKTFLSVVLLGVFSYLVQGKGYTYHRYIYLAFLCVLLSTRAVSCLRAKAPQLIFGLLTLALICFVIIPQHVRAASRLKAESALQASLERDLSRVGDSTTLDGKVFCMDLIYGCLAGLQHLNIVEDGGFTGDLLFFSPHRTEVADYYKLSFWALQSKQPAEVIVVSNEVFGQPNSYDKLLRWPAFADFLSQQFDLAVERRFPSERYTFPLPNQADSAAADSYRIYVRKNSSLRARVMALEESPNYPARL